MFVNKKEKYNAVEFYSSKSKWQSAGSPAQKKFAVLMGMQQIPYFLICSAAARAAASAFFPLRPFDLESIPDSSTGMSTLNYAIVSLTSVQRKQHNMQLCFFN